MANKYLNYEGLQRLVYNIDKKYAPISAIVFKSTVETLADLPLLADQKAGYMYNAKVGGITTDDFVEGAGHIVADGENIAAVELLTGNYTEQTLAVDADPKALGLYEINTTFTHYDPVTPVGSENPSTEGWFEFTAVTPIGSEDPSAEGWFEEDGLRFILTADTTIQAGKVYYTGTASSDSSVTPGKTYYEEITEYTYQLTEDRLPISGKKYFKADTVMKWDLMGGVFDLEDRYLEFGDSFPRDSRVVDGRTFLYMGEDAPYYVKVDTPTGRPVANNYFELDSATEITDISTIFNPKQQNLYVEDHVDPLDPSSAVFYVRSEDVDYDPAKTYFACEFVTSEDTVVDPAKIYYTEADHYKKAVIYQYDATEQDWVAQSTGGSGDFIPITDQEIDDLFI